MKKKDLTKKLFLNKKTVSNLNTFEMSNLQGGAFTDSADVPCNSNEMFCTVATCDPIFCQNTYTTCTDRISCRCN